MNFAALTVAFVHLPVPNYILILQLYCNAVNKVKCDNVRYRLLIGSGMHGSVLFLVFQFLFCNGFYFNYIPLFYYNPLVIGFFFHMSIGCIILIMDDCPMVFETESVLCCRRILDSYIRWIISFLT